MITQKHLEHWLSEIEYALTGMTNETNKPGYNKTAGIMVGGSHLSFEYLREKQETIWRLLNCIRDDIKHDDKYAGMDLTVLNRIASTDACSDEELREAVVRE